MKKIILPLAFVFSLSATAQTTHKVSTARDIAVQYAADSLGRDANFPASDTGMWHIGADGNKIGKGPHKTFSYKTDSTNIFTIHSFATIHDKPIYWEAKIKYLYGGDFEKYHWQLLSFKKSYNDF